MPKRNFAPGEVLTATNVNTYLTTSKNVLLNADFAINQRGFSSTTTSGYGLDRWNYITDGLSGTATHSVQNFTLGAAPVDGYESKSFARIVTTGQTNAGTITVLRQKIESVRTFAGQTAILSFWAKAASGTPKIALTVQQTFGGGGSPSANVDTVAGQVTISNAWARYSISVAVPSITGKTIGTDGNDALIPVLWVSGGSTYNSSTGSMGIQSNTFDIWGVQFEEGSTATPFSRATPTIQSELAACQRYYWRTSGSSAYGSYGMGIAVNTTACFVQIPFPATMRTRPTSVESLAASNYTLNGTGSPNATSIAIDASSNDGVTLNIGATYTANNAYLFRNNNNTSAYLGFSAEL